MSALANVVIAMAYFLIAMATVPIWVALPVPTWLKTGMAFAASGLFFPGCGLHHADMAAHAAIEEPVDLYAAHVVAFDLMQAVGAPLFALMALIATGRYMVIHAEAKNGEARAHAKKKGP